LNTIFRPVQLNYAYILAKITVAPAFNRGNAKIRIDIPGKSAEIGMVGPVQNPSKTMNDNMSVMKPTSNKRRLDNLNLVSNIVVTIPARTI
jgi:hypothetical protein